MVTTTEGWIALCGSILFWGTFGVPVKFPVMQKLAPHAIVIQAYGSLVVFLVGCAILLVEDFHFSWYGVMAAGMYVPANILAFKNIELIGLSAAQGLWSGVVITVAFTWGVVGAPLWDNGKSCQVGSVGLAVFGVMVLIMGLAGLAWASAPDSATVSDLAAAGVVATPSTEYSNPSIVVVVDELNNPQISCRGGYKTETSETEGIPVREVPMDCPPLVCVSTLPPTDSSATVVNLLPVVVSPDVPLVVPVVSVPAAVPIMSRRRRLTMAAICITAQGVLGGSSMVPLKFVPEEMQGLSYMFSFGVGCALVTPIYILLVMLREGSLPAFHWRETSGPSLLSGVIWTCGQVCSVFVTLSPLGMTVGFPLTQCALLVAAAWGILYFREITRKDKLLLFVAASATVIGGALIMSTWGTCEEGGVEPL